MSTDPGPVSYDHCDHVVGPFLHGTRADLAVGDELVPGWRSHFRPDQALRHVYVTTVLETAVWGAGDDPDVTDQKFPGNPTRSYRSLQPLRVVGEVADWEPHPPEVLQGMLDGLARLRAEGRDVIHD